MRGRFRRAQTAKLRIAERPPHPRSLRSLDLSPRGGERCGRSKLRLHQLGEEAAAAGQFVERAGLDDAAVAENQDPGRRANGGKPVHDDEGGAALLAMTAMRG